MTAKQWANGLDLPNLLRYSTPGQVRGLIETVIREAILAEREACAMALDIEHEDPGDTIDGVLTRAAAAIRGRQEP